MTRPYFFLAYEIKFQRKAYNKTISKTIPKYTLILAVQAYVDGVDKPIKYSLFTKYPKHAKIGSYPFRISRTTGEYIGHSLLRVLKARDELGIFFFLRKWNSMHWD